MDYEKAYKAVLQTAKQWIKDGCTDKEKICLECVFPELRESEDERIRKWLADYFGSIKETVWIHMDITCEQILGWLEKQKEQEHICDSTQYEEGFKTGLEIGLRKQKEQKPAEWSEEDENIISNIRHLLFGLAFENGGVDVNGDYCKDVYIQADDFLKSLRPSWKPSEEQMNALNFAITYFMHETNYKNPTELRELYDDLLKLK